jgi:hypothetical protein
MPKHRTKMEARGLAPATKRTKRAAVSENERKEKAEEKERRELERRVFEAALLHMGFVSEHKRDKNGKVLRGEGRDWWNVRETGEHRLDLALGEKLATEFVRYGRQRGGQSMLTHVIDGMIAKGPDYCRTVRMGFLSVICDLMPEGYDIDYESKQIVLLR